MVELKVFWLDSYTRGYIYIPSVRIDPGHKTYYRRAQHTAVPRNNVPGTVALSIGRRIPVGQRRREKRGAERPRGQIAR